jgi:hypothetical protein
LQYTAKHDRAGSDSGNSFSKTVHGLCPFPHGCALGRVLKTAISLLLKF